MQSFKYMCSRCAPAAFKLLLRPTWRIPPSTLMKSSEPAEKSQTQNIAFSLFLPNFETESTHSPYPTSIMITIHTVSAKLVLIQISYVYAAKSGKKRCLYTTDRLNSVFCVHVQSMMEHGLKLLSMKPCRYFAMCASCCPFSVTAKTNNTKRLEACTI